MVNNKSMIDCLNQNGILWQPCNVYIKNGKKYGYNSKCEKGNFTPKTNDYKNISSEEWKRRQSFLEFYEYIQIDTSVIGQLDIDDTSLGKETLDLYKSMGPYYLSATKKLPHIFINLINKELYNSKEIFNGNEKIEILNGQWATCHKNQLINNISTAIRELSDDCIKRKKVVRQNENIKCDEKKLRKLLSGIDIKFFDNRDDWLKICSAIKSCNGSFDLFDEFSKQSEYYGDTETVWNSFKECTCTIKTLIYYYNQSCSDDYSKWKIEWENDFFVTKMDSKLVYTGYNDLKIITCDKITMLKQLHILNEPGLLMRQGKMDKDLKFTPHWHTWLNDLDKKVKTGFDFLPPPYKATEDIYNTWKGFEIEQFSYTDQEKDETIKIFNDFMTHVGKKTPTMKEFMTFYIADMLQNPGRKPGIIFILTGKEGTYKGTLYDLIKCLIGKYAKQTSDSSKVFTRFNTILDKNIFLCLNEAVSIDMINNSGFLKGMATDSEMQYEEKGFGIRMGHNFTRPMITTNQSTGAKSSIHDRRNVYNETEKMDNDLRIRIRKLINSPKMNFILFEYLMNEIQIPYNNVYEWQNNRPISKKHEEIIEQFRDITNYYVYDCILSKQKEKVLYYTNSELYDRYSNYICDTKYTKKTNKILIKFLNSIDGIDKKRTSKSRGFIVNKIIAEKYLIDNKFIVIEELEELDENVPQFIPDYKDDDLE